MGGLLHQSLHPISTPSVTIGCKDLNMSSHSNKSESYHVCLLFMLVLRLLVGLAFLADLELWRKIRFWRKIKI